MERVIGISVMGVSVTGGSIFSPTSREGRDPDDFSEFRASWLEFLEKSFRDQLGRVFVEVYTAATEMRIRRVTELDNELEQVLSAGEAQRSKATGHCFLEGKSAMQRAPQWQKYARSVERGESPAHVVTVFALQAALYHLPLLSALTAYVYFEWRSGMEVFMEDEGQSTKKLSLQYLQQDYPECVKVVREVFERSGDGGQNESRLVIC